MEDVGREAHAKGKRPCEDLDQSFVEDPSFASSTAAASGTIAEVTGGSIFKILAGRKALECPCKEDVVNSASATTGEWVIEDYCYRPVFPPLDNATGVYYEHHVDNNLRVIKVVEVRYPLLPSERKRSVKPIILKSERERKSLIVNNDPNGKGTKALKRHCLDNSASVTDDAAASEVEVRYPLVVPKRKRSVKPNILKSERERLQKLK